MSEGDHRTTPELQASRQRVQGVHRRLGEFLAGSEGVFLDAGRRVAGLEQRARALVEGARAAGACRTEAGAEDPTVALGSSFQRMHDHLQASRDGISEGTRQLDALVAQIEAVLRAQSHFASIPATLRMLGLNTRIENARSSAQYAGLETVAVEVRRLGDVVEPKFRAVFDQAGGLLGAVRAALDAASGFLGGQETSCADILGQMRGALTALQAVIRAGAEIADRAAAASGRLQGHVSALLVALQGHDATRQAVEHVRDELAELEAAGGAGGAALSEVARLTSAQLRGARERFLVSLDGLDGSLEAISGVGAELSSETARFAQSGSGSSAAALVRQGVDQATRCLLQHVAHEGTTGDSMERVVVTVEEMGRSVKDIQGIGTAVKIIALNALVETERAGQSGRVLAVLAQGIGALAGEVVRRTGEVSASLEAISTAAAALRQTAARGAAAEGEAIARELEHLSLHLSALQRGMEAAVGSMREGSRTLSAEVEALAARVAQARASAEALEEAAAALADLGAGEGEAAGGEADTARAYARYTMESERAIHDHVVGGAARPSAPPGAGDPELGANVELF